jgi:hypothetical protein
LTQDHDPANGKQEGDPMQLALAWMGAEKAGYKRAAKKFNVDADELRARGRARARAKEVPPVVETLEDELLPEADGVGWSPARRVLAAPRASHTVRTLEGTAAQAVAGLVQGGRLIGLTSGQFSLLDLIRALLDLTGPADVLLSTWTAGIRDVETAAWLLGGGQIRSLRILTDRSFPTRQPKYCRRLVELFGPECLVVTRTHAKFAVIENEGWTLAVRSSMNLNKNTRWEQFDVDDDPEVAALFRGFAEEVAAASGTGIFGIETSHTDEAFEQVLAAERKIRRQTAKEVRAEVPLAKAQPVAAEPSPPGPPLVQFYRDQIAALSADLKLARGEEKWGDVTKLTAQMAAMVKTLADLEAPVVVVTPEEPAPPALDVRTLSSVARLEYELDRAEDSARRCQARGQMSTAREWAALARSIGEFLDKARLDDRTERAAREAAELRDPADLARVALAQIPLLAQLAPVEARRCLEALAIALGDVDEPEEG